MAIQAGTEHLYNRVHTAPVVQQVHGALRAIASGDRQVGASNGGATWDPPQLAAVGASFASLAVSDSDRRRVPLCVCSVPNRARSRAFLC